MSGAAALPSESFRSRIVSGRSMPKGMLRPFFVSWEALSSPSNTSFQQHLQESNSANHICNKN